MKRLIRFLLRAWRRPRRRPIRYVRVWPAWNNDIEGRDPVLGNYIRQPRIEEIPDAK